MRASVSRLRLAKFIQTVKQVKYKMDIFFTEKKTDDHQANTLSTQPVFP